MQECSSRPSLGLAHHILALRYEMPGALLSGFSQGPSEAAWPQEPAQEWPRPGHRAYWELVSDPRAYPIPAG